MRCSESMSKIAPALVLALSKIEGAAKTGNNDHFRSKYATLEAVIEASRDTLAEHELAIIQLPGALNNGVLTLETILLHSSGEYIAGDFGIALGKTDPQGVGSALTYARRYAQMAALNMPAVDDDGEASMRGGGSAASNDVPKNGNGPAPEGPDWWGCAGSGMTANAAKKVGVDARHEDMRAEIGNLSTGQEWRDWCRVNAPEIAKMPKAWRVILRDEAEIMAKELGVDLSQRRAA